LTNPGYPKTTKVHENELKSNLIKMINAITEKMNIYLEEITENRIKHVKKMNKTVEHLNIEIIKKSQTEEILEMKNLAKGTGIMDTSINKKIQEMEDRISGLEDTIEEIDIPVKRKS
jgi:recombinational DNA repair ATPase RecF